MSPVLVCAAVSVVVGAVAGFVVFLLLRADMQVRIVAQTQAQDAAAYGRALTYAAVPVRRRRWLSVNRNEGPFVARTMPFSPVPVERPARPKR